MFFVNGVGKCMQGKNICCRFLGGSEIFARQQKWRVLVGAVRALQSDRNAYFCALLLKKNTLLFPLLFTGNSNYLQ